MRWSRVAVAVAALGLIGSTASAQTTDDLRDQLDERQAQRSEAREQLAETREQEGDARERLARADRQLDEATAELARVEEALAAAREAREAALAEADRLRSRLERVERRLERTEAELEETQDRFESRVAGSFKRGATSTETALVGQLLAADDISEALSTAPFLTAVIDHDRQLVDDVTELVREVQEQRADVAATRVAAEREAREAVALAEQIAETAAEQRELTQVIEERRAEREAALEELRDDRQAIEGHLTGLEEESSRLSAQLEAIAAEQAAQAEREAREAREAAEAEAARQAEAAARQAQAEKEARERAQASSGSSGPSSSGSGSSGGSASSGSGSSSGGSSGGGSGGSSGSSSGGSATPPPTSTAGWTRPSGGSLTSPFGPRWGRNHNGVDIGGAVGSSVVASRSGTVVNVTSACHPTSSFGCGGGFGNHVVVSHASGMATVYAHLATVSVGVGQSVGAGQQLGGVGNSGNSYGAHLHFEVRESGTPRDPCRYISC